MFFCTVNFLLVLAAVIALMKVVAEGFDPLVHRIFELFESALNRPPTVDDAVDWVFGVEV